MMLVIILVVVLYLVSIPFAWLMTKLGHQIVLKNISPKLTDVVLVFLPLANITVGLFYAGEILKSKSKRKINPRKFFKI
ncbi:hypothetical protein [Bacillus nakamurai]|uniref:hypothetical protein n=1 Tax=Bacillus nakamurai TaxID=1793963 RepID=UPI001E451797|nr:hypothetical protein [Bacillus nakamurai]MCC9020947.1 hypothetical protein [Bacillus nakamurai]